MVLVKLEISTSTLPRGHPNRRCTALETCAKTLQNDSCLSRMFCLSRFGLCYILQLLAAVVYSFPAAAAAFCSWLKLLSCSWRLVPAALAAGSCGGWLVPAAGGWFLRLAA
eukprot:769000-Prymnesium_polylepis.1